MRERNEKKRKKESFSSILTQGGKSGRNLSRLTYERKGKTLIATSAKQPPNSTTKPVESAISSAKIDESCSTSTSILFSAPESQKKRAEGLPLPPLTHTPTTPQPAIYPRLSSSASFSLSIFLLPPFITIMAAFLPSHLLSLTMY